jgi:ring-1,2-phenylacetyl-CoA epoxidase subunit PaaC
MSTDTNKAIFEFALRLGDSSLILGHRLSEWCGHGPILEEDIALTNIALDLIGQSRMLLTYAGQVEGKGRTEDNLAYLRDARDFRNALITEQLNGDYARTIVRQFFYTSFALPMYEALTKSSDTTLAAIAAKAVKEITYHLRHSSEWVVRMGDGTEESNRRVSKAVEELYPYVGDMFAETEGYKMLVEKNIVPEMAGIRTTAEAGIKSVLKRATLTAPEKAYMHTGSEIGSHSEHLGYLLAEMQFLQRAYPGAEW